MFEKQLSEFPWNPPRRSEALPGLRISAVLPKSAWILPAVFCLFFTIIPLSIILSDPAIRLSWGSSKTTQGIVLSTTDIAACHRAGKRIIFSFAPAQGQTFRGLATVCEDSSYYTLKAGDTVEVRYLVSDPAINELSDSVSNQPPVALIFLMPLFGMVLFLSLYAPQFRELLHARKLIRHGRLTQGTVVFVKKRTNMMWPGLSGSSSYEIFVEFLSPTSGRWEATAWCANDWLVNQLLPGSTVHLVYRDQTPSKVAILEAFLR